MSREKKSLSWFIPFSIHKQQAIREIKEQLPPMFFVRVTVAFTAVFFSIRYALLRWLPERHADWFSLYWRCILPLVLIIAVAWLVAFVPPQVIIDRKGIRFCRGQSVTFYRFENIASVRIIEGAKPLPLLRINFFTQYEEKEYLIAPTVPLARLGAMLDEFRLRSSERTRAQ